MQRRDLLRSGGFAGIAMLSGRAFAQTGVAGDKLIPWSDQPPPVPPPLENVAKGLTRWEDLGSWITPNDKFFSIAHYGRRSIPKHGGWMCPGKSANPPHCRWTS